MLLTKDQLSVAEAAEVIGCTDGRVRQLLGEGRIEGEKIGERVWVVSRKSAENYRDSELPPGRPRINS